MYRVIEEASEAAYMYSEDLSECINYASEQLGKYLVLDEDDNVLYDSQPNVSYKI